MEEQKPKRRTSPLAWVLLVLFLLILGPCTLGYYRSATQSERADQGARGTAQTTSAPGDSVDEWRDVFILESQGPKNSDPFELSGADAKLVFEANNERVSGAPLFVSLEQGSGEGVGESLVSAETPAKGETRIFGKKGRFYLDVNTGPGTRYRLVVQQLS